MPMPRTHFLAGVVTTQILGILGVQVSFIEVLFGGLLALLLELDHVLLYWKKKRNLNFLHDDHNALEQIEEEQSFLHQWNGWMLVLFVTVVIAYFNRHYAIIFFSVLTIHQLLDYEPIRKIYTNYVKEAHFVYPKNLREWSIDISLLALIVVLSLL